MSKAPLVRAAILLGGMAIVSNCVSAPQPAPAPRTGPPPAPAPAPAPAAADWRDWPVAPGVWSYNATERGTLAAFGVPGAPAQLSFRCEPETHRIYVARATTLPAQRIGGQMTVHTSFGAAQWPVTGSTEAGVPAAYAVAIRAGSDAAFDRIAFSRGRFAVEVPGAAPIAVPGWAEVSRVIEDCRG